MRGSTKLDKNKTEEHEIVRQFPSRVYKYSGTSKDYFDHWPCG